MRMEPRMRIPLHIPALLLVPLSLSPAFSSAASGEGPELDMFVVPSSEFLSPGETASIAIYTFIDGKRTSFDGPVEASVAGGLYGVNLPLPVRSVSMGVYEFNYTMTASHVGSYGYVQLVVRASNSAGVFAGSSLSTDYKYLSLWLSGAHPFSVREGISARARLVELSSPVLAPGTLASFLCCITMNGAPFDPEWVMFNMEHSASGDEPLNYSAAHTRISTGVYRVNFTIPDVRHDDYFSLYVLASGAEGPLYTDASLSLDFFTVIYHELKRDGSLVSFEILLSDRNGAPVKGADVLVRARLPGREGSEIVLELGSTDSKGRVTGSLPMTSMSDAFYIAGWANTSRYSQKFYASIPLPGDGSRGPVETESFTVVPLSYEPSLEPLPGESVCATYRAFWQGRPLAGMELKCFVTSRAYERSRMSFSSVECVVVETDAEGVFSLCITMPSGESSVLKLFFKNPMPPPQTGGYSPGDYEYIYSGSPEENSIEVRAELSRAHPGGRLRARVHAPGMGAFMVRAYLGLESEGEEGAPWQVCSSPIWYLRGPDNDGAFSGTIPLPVHLRPGTNATIHFILSDETTRYIERSFEFRIQPAPAPAPEADLCCLAGLAVLNIGLILFLLVSYIAARRTPQEGERGGELEKRVEEMVRKAQEVPGGVPRRVALDASGTCAVCGRRIARGNIALVCSCGKQFHEHCTGEGNACPACGRRWSGRGE